MKEALLFDRKENKVVECKLCSHRCVILPDKFGLCGARKNQGGTLYSLVYGEVIAGNVDPIEKKPLYHFLPGSLSFSIATVGCNFQCSFCQNWKISQALFNNSSLPGTFLPPENIVAKALRAGCKSISYTYTEPTIFYEYVFDIAKLAREAGLKNIVVTNGFMTKEVLENFQPYIDAYNIDLKSFNDDFYKDVCHSSLMPVLETIECLSKSDVWLEITTLLISEENDSEDELRQLAEFIANCSNMIPWHISRFRPEYKWLDKDSTSLISLKKARCIGLETGLKYVYLGNVVDGSNTYCPSCGQVIIERNFYDVCCEGLVDSRCNNCKYELEGSFF